MEVSNRAGRFFRDGRPFSDVLRANQNLLQEAVTIRNAIAHKSNVALEKFENLVRSKLGTLPANLTVGGVLVTTLPGSTPPVSFLEWYIDRIEFAAQRIVPS
jgi:hypothetical protein